MSCGCGKSSEIHITTDPSLKQIKHSASEGWAKNSGNFKIQWKLTYYWYSREGNLHSTFGEKQARRPYQYNDTCCTSEGKAENLSDTKPTHKTHRYKVNFDYSSKLTPFYNHKTCLILGWTRKTHCLLSHFTTSVIKYPVRSNSIPPWKGERTEIHFLLFLLYYLIA